MKKNQENLLEELMAELMVENGRAFASWRWVEEEWPGGTKAQGVGVGGEQHSEGLHLLKNSSVSLSVKLRARDAKRTD